MTRHFGKFLVVQILALALLGSASAGAQPFTGTQSFGGGASHDLKIDGRLYRVFQKPGRVGLVNDLSGEVVAVGELPTDTDYAWIHGFRWKDQLLLSYGIPNDKGSASKGGILVSLDSQTLQEKWRKDLTEYTDALYVDGDSAYLAVGGLLEKIHLATGKTIWSHPHTGWEFGQPRLEGANVIYPSQEMPLDLNRFWEKTSEGYLALDKATGETVDVQEDVFEPILFKDGRPLLRVDGPVQNQGYLHLYDLGRGSSTSLCVSPNGKIALWDLGASKPRITGSLPLGQDEGVGFHYAGILEDAILLYYDGDRGLSHLVVLDRTSLAKIWEYSLPSRAFRRPGNSEDAIYLVVGGNAVQKIDIKTGRLLWDSGPLGKQTDDTRSLHLLSTPTVSRGRLTLVEIGQFVSRADGEQMPIVEKGKVILDERTGRVVKLEPSRFERSITP